MEQGAKAALWSVANEAEQYAKVDSHTMLSEHFETVADHCNAGPAGYLIRVSLGLLSLVLHR